MTAAPGGGGSPAWQLDLASARLYQDVLVPAILGPFAHALVSALAPAPGDAIADVGCGTGAAARRAAELAGAGGSVIGLDVNAAMLRVARELPRAGGAPIEWREAPAERLDLPDGSVDLVICAQVLQFVRDRGQALRELRRVARPGARIGLSVWCPLDENPYFAALADAVTRHLGAEAAAGLRAVFSLSERTELSAALAEADLPSPSLGAQELRLELPPPERFVPRHLAATPVAGAFEQASPETREAVVAAVRERLGAHATGSGMRVPFRSWLVRVTLPAARTR